MLDLEMVKQAAFEDELQKIAREGGYTVRPELNQSLALMSNAMDNNIADPLSGRYMKNRDLVARAAHSQGIGALIGGSAGVALGAGTGVLAAALAKKSRLSGAGLGAYVGGIGGLATGAILGNRSAENEYLKDKGIKRSGISGLLGYTSATPEAFRKYKTKPKNE
jgi:hypothetical protein